MLSTVLFLASVAVQSAYAQADCVPDPVGSIALDANNTLYWEASTNCDAIEYIIYINTEEGQYTYTTNNTYLDVSLLPACEDIYFEVRAFSGHQLSEGKRLDAYIPVNSMANLKMSSFSVIQEDETLFLMWEMQERFAHCARGFRVVVRDEFADNPRDIYTTNNYLFLDGFVPCGEYEIGVMALYSDESEGPISQTTYTKPAAASSAPVLESVIPGDTYVNLSLTVDSYSVNRCPITSIMVDGSPYLSNQIFPVEDSPARPTINIVLRSLQPDKMYVLNVYVVNTFGRSRNFPVAVQTLPQSTDQKVNL